MRIPIQLVFDDLRRAGVSIYHTEEGMELSSGDFHSGTTFPGTIELDAGQAADFAEMRSRDIDLVFWVPTAGAPEVPS